MKKNRLARKTEQRAGRRFDRPGHLDPEYASRLLDLSGAPRSETYKAFVGFGAERDELAARFAESTVRKMTQSEEAFDELDEPTVPEGGPFVAHAVADQWPDEPLILEVAPPPEPFPPQALAKPDHRPPTPSSLFRKIPPLSDLVSWARSRAEETALKIQGWSRHQLERSRRRPA